MMRLCLVLVGVLAATPVAAECLRPIPLDVATVTTGATAVTALAAGNRQRGGWLYNPSSATIKLCIDEQTTASGTSSAGSLTCILPGQSYNLIPSMAPVSVVTSDSAHPFSGMGWARSSACTE